ncbi:MAG: GyrI-like domain-containing protein [Thermoplasmata archaeon]|nr:GyrI-like domain-containing protein [Thermoplasmata archaeon]
MVVDFELKKAKKFTAATVTWKGPWNEKRVRSEFEGLAKWIGERHARAGAWILQTDWEKTTTVAIEVRGKVAGDGGVRVRRFPASRVASVTFDPEAISPRVIYHGLSDWLRWRKKDHSIKGVGTYREIYPGNPWKNAKAWSATEVRVTVR